ncbi:MAG: hypothetical protein Q4E66_03305, partial [Comamonadaceae bacterium]|nr:hypothetical protein [Comamonadaceae bacterium]
LDKLRNAVQKFGSHSFTTVQVARDYQGDEQQLSAADTQHFEALLRRHAALLGIAPQVSGTGGATVWQALS